MIGVMFFLTYLSNPRAFADLMTWLRPWKCTSLRLLDLLAGSISMTHSNKGNPVDITNIHNLPQPIVSLLSRHKYSRGASDISVTELLSPPQISILKRAHHHNLVEDISDRFWALMGTNIHKLLEDHANETVQTEERLFLEMDGWTLSGQIDVQREQDGAVSIMDWKFTGVYSAMTPKQDWIAQLNMYAYLVETVKKIQVDKLQVIAILRDWSKTKVKTQKNYPPAPIMNISLPLWSYEERHAFLKDRVALHQEAQGAHELGGALPECTDEERWVRKGKAVRCEEYCIVKEYCEQYRRSRD